MRKMKPRLTRDQREMLLTFYARGDKTADIAAQLGVSRSYVSRFAGWAGMRRLRHYDRNEQGGRKNLVATGPAA